MRTLVVLPTYNEAENVELMLRALRESVPGADVLVVDDASARRHRRRSPSASARRSGASTILRSATTKDGLGGAYRAGFAWGLERGYDHFVEIDCDFSHDPHALPSLLAAAETHDVVIGSRYVPGGTIPNWSIRRLWLSRGGNQYASVMLGLRVRDSTAGYRVYSQATRSRRSTSPPSPPTATASRSR